jgi:carbonic anhydrase/acetyltransferase-like protein (isoleucine patch superfamily)
MLLRYQDRQPDLQEPCFVAPGAHLIGAVRLGRDASVWFNAVLRADESPILIGAGSNLQDGVVVHTDRELVCTVGERVTVGHRAILHGCTIADEVLVGMGAIILNRARIGTHCLIGAGAVVTEDADIPAGSLVLGVPGRVVRPLTSEEILRIQASADHYIQLWKQAGWQ